MTDLHNYITPLSPTEIKTGRITKVSVLPGVPKNQQGHVEYPAYPDWFYSDKDGLKGFCLWCGNELSGRQRSYCCGSCSYDFQTAHRSLGISSVRLLMHKCNDFKCVKCGEVFFMASPAGVRIPMYSGEVDHVRPLFKGGSDHWENLQLLCKQCHRIKTSEERKSTN